MKKVSVIMGIYNCADTLAEAINSIVNQTYENWELILCDDASQDNTYEVASTYVSKYPGKILLIRNEKNQRLAGTLNHCLKYVTGDYIARMDGDDISVSNRFERQVAFLDAHPEYDLVGTAMISFDETGDIGIKSTIPEPDKYTLRFNTPFAHATIMARKEVYQRLGGYRIAKEIKRCEDVDLWFRFYEAGFSGYNLKEALYKVRERQSDFKRRTFSDGIDAARVCYRGYKRLNYPLKYYVFLFKPIISSMMPAWLMKQYHNAKDAKNKK